MVTTIRIHQIHHKTLWIRFHLCCSNPTLVISTFILTYKLLFFCTLKQDKGLVYLIGDITEAQILSTYYRSKTKELTPIPFAKPIMSFWCERKDVNSSKSRPVWNRMGLWGRELSIRWRVFALSHIGLWGKDQYIQTVPVPFFTIHIILLYLFNRFISVHAFNTILSA